MAGSIWRLGAMASSLDTILEKDDVTVEEVLEEDDLLQETKQGNTKLVNFLSSPASLKLLFRYIVDDPDPSEGPSRCYKFPYVASEVLSCDLPSVYSVLFSEEGAELLDCLFGLLEQPPPLNPLLAGYFNKVVTTLVLRQQPQLLAYFEGPHNPEKGKEWLIRQMLVHIGTQSILELLQTLFCKQQQEVVMCGTGMSSGDMEEESNTHELWMSSGDLIKLLLDALGNNADTEARNNTALLLCSLMQRADSGQSLAILQSEPMVVQLLDLTLSGSSSALNSGLTVAMQLLECHIQHCNPIGHSSPPLTPLIACVLQRLDEFTALLHSPPAFESPLLDATSISNTQFMPVGSCRLHILCLFRTLFESRNEVFYGKFVSLKVLDTALDLMFEHVWNNGLHEHVEAIVMHILQSDNDTLLMALLNEPSLVDRIVEATVKNDTACSGPKGCRQGHMGHVVRIANALVHASESNEVVQNALSCAVQWQAYVSGSLADWNLLEATELGGAVPLRKRDDSDDDDVYESVTGMHDSSSLLTSGDLNNNGWDEDEGDEQGQSSHYDFDMRQHLEKDYVNNFDNDFDQLDDEQDSWKADFGDDGDEIPDESGAGPFSSAPSWSGPSGSDNWANFDMDDGPGTQNSPMFETVSDLGASFPVPGGAASWVPDFGDDGGSRTDPGTEGWMASFDDVDPDDTSDLVIGAIGVDDGRLDLSPTSEVEGMKQEEKKTEETEYNDFNYWRLPF